LSRTRPLCLLLLLMAAAAGASPDPKLVTVVRGLDHPWSLAFLPDGRLLVTERSGQLRRITATGEVGPPIAGVPPVYFAGQGGLLDVLLDPEFARNQRLYLSLSHGDAKASATRLIGARLTEDALEDVEVLFTTTPFKATPQHCGGRLALLPDGTVLMTIGDGWSYREHAQRLDSQLGKTVRLHRDGSIPADNPFAGEGPAEARAVWTLGHRNPQGLALDPATGTVYLHEHGPRGGDEINVLRPGGNYGWPVLTEGLDYLGGRITPFTEAPGMTAPMHGWTPSIAPSGLAVYRGGRYPGWDGSLFAGGLVSRDVRRVWRRADGTVAEETLFADLGERMRDIRVAPDGLLYLVTDGPAGAVIRLAPGDNGTP